jgi:hypothetical protein
MSLASDQRMYSLADFLGCKLQFTPGKLIGTGKWKQDCGLLAGKLSATILTSIAGDDTNQPLVLVLGLAGDLALGIHFASETMAIKILVLDKQTIDPVATFFEREACVIPRDGFIALHKHAKRCYQGKLRNPLAEVAANAMILTD